MTLPPHIQDLLDPGAHPDRPGTVELVQTHISYILLTPELAYKIKKPVDFGFLDFTTLEKRRHFCEEEVRLNKRLAPDVYLGVVEVTEDDGRTCMEGPGRVVDYAVKMRRLAGDGILEEGLKKDAVTGQTIRRVARRIARFHREAATDERIAGFGSPGAIEENVRENFTQTRGQVDSTITPGLYDEIQAYSLGFIRDNAGLLKKRASEGFIRDCHGDIHTEHISVGKEIEIFDCIEFNERFRYSDTIADLAFLSMDLDFHNRSDLTQALEDEYLSETGDADGGGLLGFYKCYRAYVRGKVEGFKHAEGEVPDEERTRAFVEARHHFHLSGQYARGGFSPLLIIVRGLSGTGKSSLAGTLAEATGAKLYSSDRVRKELAGLEPEEHDYAAFKQGIYTDAFTRKTYTELIRRGTDCLKARRTAILDATFSKREYIEEAVAGAKKAGAEDRDIFVIECTAPDETIRGRVARRPPRKAAPGAAASDIRPEILDAQKKEYEPVTTTHARIDTSGTVQDSLLAAVKYIYS